MRYVLDFGSVNAGGSPTFDVWSVLSTLTPVTPPAITEIGFGQYRFDYAGNDTIVYKSTLGGVEKWDVLSPNQTPGVRYALDFGAANAGGAPVFTIFSRLDTGAALTQPAFIEIGSGLYAFDFNFASAPLGVTDVTYKAELGGVEVSGVISTVSTGGRAGYKTAGTIINRAAVQLGLSAYADPYASADANAVLLRELLATLGEDLVTQHEWTNLVKDASIVTVAGQTSYQLPDDYDRMVDQTAWNRSSTWPMFGPVSQQTEQLLRVFSATALLAFPFRMAGSSVQMTVSPPEGSLLVLKYISHNWVQSVGSDGADLDGPTQAGDLCLFDPLLLIMGLKLRWLEVKGFDTTVAYAAYRDRLDNARTSDTGARVLSMEQKPLLGRFIDMYNSPPTGLGT
jgi:hypothetical protein